MNKTRQTLSYLAKNMRRVIVIGFLCILGTLALSDLIFSITNQYDIPQSAPTPGPIVPITGIIALVTGLVLLLPTFKVALANGISRKTFMLANIPVACMLASAFSIINLILAQINALLWPMSMNNEGIGWDLWELILLFTIYFVLITAGWFISLAYYRSSVPVRWVISMTSLAVLGMLPLADFRSGGAITEAFGNYWNATMGMDRAPFTLLAYSAVLCVLVYLLLRRAPLKD